jgi:hypothetical protein
MLFVVMLYLTVWDCDTGTKLYEARAQVDALSYLGRIEDCRILGVDLAKKLTKEWRVDYPNASTNVNCQWEQRGFPFHR